MTAHRTSDASLGARSAASGRSDVEFQSAARVQEWSLALAPLSLQRPPPLEMIEAAAAGGFAACGLRLVDPKQVLAPLCTDRQLLRAAQVALAQSGIKILEISTIELIPEFDLAGLRPVIDTALALGARLLQVTGWDPDEKRATENLHALAETCQAEGIQIGVEFMSYSVTATLRDAVRLIDAVKLPNLGVIADFLHLDRSGTSIQELEDEQEHVILVQLCDAPSEHPPFNELRKEAVGGRLLPGAGSLPVGKMLDAFGVLPPISVEAPWQAASGGPSSRAEEARLIHDQVAVYLDAWATERVDICDLLRGRGTNVMPITVRQI